MQYNLIENGDYDAKVAGAASVYESSKGNLVACFLVKIGDVDKKFFSSLTQEQGSVVNERAVGELKKIFPEWSGDPAWLQEGDNINGEVVVVRVENQKSEKDGNTYSNVRGMYHPDHVPDESTAEMPNSMDKKTLTAKYASKFRAVAGAGTGKGAGKPAPRRKPPTEPKPDIDDIPF